MTRFTKLLLALLTAVLLIGCAGTKTFHEYARAGDTIIVAAGYKKDFQRDNITVTAPDGCDWQADSNVEWISVTTVPNLPPDARAALAARRAGAS